MILLICNMISFLQIKRGGVGSQGHPPQDNYTTFVSFYGYVDICVCMSICDMHISFHSAVNHIRKIHGHKYKDEADKDIPATKYSHLFKTTFDPLYHTLEKTTFNLNEDESSFVVNKIFQVLL